MTIAATIIATCYVGVFAALLFAIYRTPPASRSPKAAEQDELELLYGLPAYRDLDLDAGLDRLRDAIRDEQTKGEQ